MSDIEYVRPQDLKGALSFLAENGRETEIIAGGTDVMVDIRAGKLQKKFLLDVSRLKELKGIEKQGKSICVGAGVTLSEIYDSRILKQSAPALQKSSFNFASKQIRNVATIGGNIAHSSPCGDTIPPLVIHEATALVAGKNGKRLVPVEDIAAAPYRSSLAYHEIIVNFFLKSAEVEFSAFRKIGRRKELSISRISMAAMANRDGAGKISFIRISLGACTPTPHRMKEAEDFLMGKIPTQEQIWQAGRFISEKMIEITGRRASAVYKEPAVQGLFMRMFYEMV